MTSVSLLTFITVCLWIVAVIMKKVTLSGKEKGMFGELESWRKLINHMKSPLPEEVRASRPPSSSLSGAPLRERSQDKLATKERLSLSASVSAAVFFHSLYLFFSSKPPQEMAAPNQKKGFGGEGAAPSLWGHKKLLTKRDLHKLNMRK